MYVAMLYCTLFQVMGPYFFRYGDKSTVVIGWLNIPTHIVRNNKNAGFSSVCCAHTEADRDTQFHDMVGCTHEVWIAV